LVVPVVVPTSVRLVVPTFVAIAVPVVRIEFALEVRPVVSGSVPARAQAGALKVADESQNLSKQFFVEIDRAAAWLKGGGDERGRHDGREGLPLPCE
jgi:hypothetical protein